MSDRSIHLNYRALALLLHWGEFPDCYHSFLVYQVAQAIISFADTACTFGIGDVTLVTSVRDFV